MNFSPKYPVIRPDILQLSGIRPDSKKHYPVHPYLMDLKRKQNNISMSSTFEFTIIVNS
jgi:hypothetical protein